MYKPTYCNYKHVSVHMHDYTQTQMVKRLEMFQEKKKLFMQSDIIKNTHCILEHTHTHTRRSCWLRELGELRKEAILVGNVV